MGVHIQDTYRRFLYLFMESKVHSKYPCSSTHTQWSSLCELSLSWPIFMLSVLLPFVACICKLGRRCGEKSECNVYNYNYIIIATPLCSGDTYASMQGIALNILQKKLFLPISFSDILSHLLPASST